MRKIKEYTNDIQQGFDYEGDILPVIKEQIEDSYDEWSNDLELHPFKSEEAGEEINNKSSPGFIPFTDGGYVCMGFLNISNVIGNGLKLPTKEIQAEVDRIQTMAYTEAAHWFKREYPEIFNELGENNIDYHSLYDAGYGSEAEELSEYEMDWMEAEIAIEVGCYYYTPENDKNDLEGQHSCYVFCNWNDDYEYYRLKGKHIIYDESFAFNSTIELENKLSKFMNTINNIMS